MWHVYILKCDNGCFYTGITKDIERRLNDHKSGKGGHFTRSFGAKEIVYSEECSDKSKALKREAQIKGWTRKKKISLIEGKLKSLKELKCS